MEIFFASFFAFIITIVIMLMLVYGLIWSIVNIQLYLIDKALSCFTSAYKSMYSCMSDAQRDFIDSNLNSIQLEISTEENEIKSISLADKENKITDSFIDVEKSFHKYEDKIAKSCMIVKIIVCAEFKYYMDVFSIFSTAAKIN